MGETKTYVFGNDANTASNNLLASILPALQNRGIDSSYLMGLMSGNNNGGFFGNNGGFQDIIALIGPAISMCCYEVSEELKQKFIDKFNVPSEKLFNGRNLSMELCIEEDLKSIGIKDDNIYSLNLCTHCEKENKLFSYRGSNGTYGRLFSFSYIK